MNNNLYERQKSIKLFLPPIVTVIGVGGVGSWVAMNVALVGVKKLYLFDSDYIDCHNLNRTLFRIQDIGKYKVSAMAELIYERREDVEVCPITSKIEDAGEDFDEVKDSLLIDCRDTVSPPIKGKTLIMGGYDGDNITLHFNPRYESIFGVTQEAATYSITPSYLVPPQFISNIITAFITRGLWRSNKKEVITSFKIQDMVNYLYKNKIRGE